MQLVVPVDQVLQLTHPNERQNQLLPRHYRHSQYRRNASFLPIVVIVLGPHGKHAARELAVARAPLPVLIESLQLSADGAAPR